MLEFLCFLAVGILIGIVWPNFTKSIFMLIGWLTVWVLYKAFRHFPAIFCGYFLYMAYTQGNAPWLALATAFAVSELALLYIREKRRKIDPN